MVRDIAHTHLRVVIINGRSITLEKLIKWQMVWSNLEFQLKCNLNDVAKGSPDPADGCDIFRDNSTLYFKVTLFIVQGLLALCKHLRFILRWPMLRVGTNAGLKVIHKL